MNVEGIIRSMKALCTEVQFKYGTNLVSNRIRTIDCGLTDQVNRIVVTSGRLPRKRSVGPVFLILVCRTPIAVTTDDTIANDP